MNDMPSHVLIGSINYRIVPFDVRDSMDSGNLGECRKERAELAVATWPAPAVMAEVLWHEINHGIWDAMNLPENADEEMAVAGFTKGLLAVWLANPRLVAWTEAALLGQGAPPMSAEDAGTAGTTAGPDGIRRRQTPAEKPWWHATPETGE